MMLDLQAAYWVWGSNTNFCFFPWTGNILLWTENISSFRVVSKVFAKRSVLVFTSNFKPLLVFPFKPGTLLLPILPNSSSSVTEGITHSLTWTTVLHSVVLVVRKQSRNYFSQKALGEIFTTFSLPPSKPHLIGLYRHLGIGSQICGFDVPR